LPIFGFKDFYKLAAGFWSLVFGHKMASGVGVQVSAPDIFFLTPET
jgi:hypothetical protein